MLNIPAALTEEIRRGRVVLLLGAGASIGAKKNNGQGSPTGNQLRDALADRFLGGNYKDSPLAWVAELAISETDLPRVQDFIAELFSDMQPTPFHQSLTTFKWRGIATTNYDLIMENAYGAKGAAQKLVPCISDRDRLDEKLRAADSLAYLKLHGCMTKTHDPDLPLILTADQYVTHRTGRKYLFTTFEQWAFEYPVLFVGSSGQDPDLRALLLEVSREPEMRPRFYLLKPGTTETEIRFWESKRITVIDGTLEQMIASLEVEIPKEIRSLLRARQVDHPIKRRFIVDEEVSSLLEDFLANDVEYVHESISVLAGSPAAFYRGFDLGWYPIVNALDVRRRLVDLILNDVVIRAEEDRPSPTELYIIKAEAGAGKTILLRRLAWDAANSADCLCLYLRDFGTLRYEGIKELYRVTQQRIFLFVDGAIEHSMALATLVANSQRDRLQLTVFTSERMNVWNMGGERLLPLLTDNYDLRYLSHTEIENLVNLLTKHDSLGPHLNGKTSAECVKQFEEQAGRQILVALHEATMGMPFEDILVDEYNQIQPRAAQDLYLTVCTLNRLNVPVRAGLIARVHGMGFEQFKDRLFLPLEHVVKAEQNQGTQDYLYSARHPEIAQIVFDRILRTPQDRYNEYIRILNSMNLAYNTDRDAISGMMRARALHELFPNYQDVKSLFDAAIAAGPNEASIYQQQANYERIRPNGNLGHAEKLLQHARDLEPHNPTLLHTLSEIKRTQAENATELLEREKLRNEARALLRPLLKDTQNDRYARHTMVKLSIDDLRDTLANCDATNREIDAAVRNVEDLLLRGLQQCPGDNYLLITEADYSRILKDHDRSFEALKRAFSANRRDTYIANRLARLYEERGALEDAQKILHEALQANRGDHQLNFQYANILRRKGQTDQSVLLYHYRRSFTKWDANYDAQFWFARYAYESANAVEVTESKDAFKRLRSVPLPFELRRQVRDTIGENTIPAVLYGTISRLEFAHGFVERDRRGDFVFFHKAECATEEWTELHSGLRVSFNVGFSFNGPVAINLSPL